MESREAVFKALKEGKKLMNDVTGIQYKLIDGKLHSRHSERKNWDLSGLDFFYAPSWLNMHD